MASGTNQRLLFASRARMRSSPLGAFSIAVLTNGASWLPVTGFLKVIRTSSVTKGSYFGRPLSSISSNIGEVSTGSSSSSGSSGRISRTSSTVSSACNGDCDSGCGSSTGGEVLISSTLMSPELIKSSPKIGS